MKITAIGQALINLARPSTILCPLLLAFAAKMHHKSGGSEFVVQQLHSMGFGFSIEKVRELEKSFCFHDSSPGIVDFNEFWAFPSIQLIMQISFRQLWMVKTLFT